MTTMFGNPGSTELPMLADFPSDFRYVLGLQEAVVVGMADGYAQASGKTTVVNLHTAPGVGNAMGAIFNAQANHSPLLITAGQQARAQITLQANLTNRDATRMPHPLVKWSYEPPRAEDVPLALAHGAHLAGLPPRGPVFVSLPMDDWYAEVDEADAARGDRPQGRRPRRRRPRGGPRPRRAARRRAPTRSSSPAPTSTPAAPGTPAIALAERQRLPVWASPATGGVRLGFPENHPNFRGVLPPAIGPVGQTLEGHDLILVVGSSVFPYYPHIPGPLLPDRPPAPSSPPGEPVEPSPGGFRQYEGVTAEVRLGAQDVADRPHGMNQARLATGFERLANVADDHLDDVRVAQKLVDPDFLEQLARLRTRSGWRRKHASSSNGAVTQADGDRPRERRVCPDRGRTSAYVEHPPKASVGDRAGGGQGAAATQRPQASQQLFDGKRLGQVVVGARVQPGDPILEVGARGEHENGHAARGAQAAGYFQTVHARQGRLEQHDFGSQGGKGGQCGNAVRRPARHDSQPPTARGRETKTCAGRPQPPARAGVGRFVQSLSDRRRSALQSSQCQDCMNATLE